MMNSGGSPPVLRQINQGLVLETLRGAGLLRLGELSQRTGLSRPTVSAILDELSETGWVNFVDEHPKGRAGLGRPARLVEFRAGAGYVVGIDIGSHRTTVGVADLEGTVVARARAETARAVDQRRLFSVVRATITDALRQGGVPREAVLSAVAGSPGIIDRETGTVRTPSLGWSHLKLGAELRRSFPHPVQVENDINLAVLGERWRGAAADAHTVLFVQWGERIGAGISIDGQLHFGHSSAAGELGFVNVLTDKLGPTVDEQGRGALEREASAGAVVALGRREARRGGALAEAIRSGKLDAAAVFDAAQAGDRGARRVVDTVVGRLARGLAPAILLLDPDVTVIGGGISRSGPTVLDALRRALDPLTLVPNRLVLSTLGEDAVVLGAIRLALTDVEERVLPHAGRLEAPAAREPA